MDANRNCVCPGDKIPKFSECVCPAGSEAAGDVCICKDDTNAGDAATDTGAELVNGKCECPSNQQLVGDVGADKTCGCLADDQVLIGRDCLCTDSNGNCVG